MIEYFPNAKDAYIESMKVKKENKEKFKDYILSLAEKEINNAVYNGGRTSCLLLRTFILKASNDYYISEEELSNLLMDISVILMRKGYKVRKNESYSLTISWDNEFII